MFKIQKIYPRDTIGILSVIGCFILMAMKINNVVSLIVVSVITYYFSKRIYEEKNGYEEKPVETEPEIPEEEVEKPQPIEYSKPVMPVEPRDYPKKYSQEIKPLV